MKASELIARLLELIHSHGDIPVVCNIDTRESRGAYVNMRKEIESGDVKFKDEMEFETETVYEKVSDCIYIS